MNPNKRPRKDGASLESRPSKKQKSVPILEEIINNPGLQHIAEEIFLNLDFKSIMACKLASDSCKEIVDNPMFWLKKWKLSGRLSNENHKNWVKAIQITKNTSLEKNVLAYMKRIIKIGHFVDVSNVTPIHFAAMTDVIKYLAPLAENPNAPENKFGHTPI